MRIVDRFPYANPGKQGNVTEQAQGKMEEIKEVETGTLSFIQQTTNRSFFSASVTGFQELERVLHAHSNDNHDLWNF